MRRPVRSNNITNRKLFNNGGFPTMGAQAQMPNPLNVNMGGTLPQANNIMAPSGILASSTELSNAVGDQALAQSFAPTANMNSGGIASFAHGGTHSATSFPGAQRQANAADYLNTLLGEIGVGAQNVGRRAVDTLDNLYQEEMPIFGGSPYEPKYNTVSIDGMGKTVETEGTEGLNPRVEQGTVMMLPTFGEVLGVTKDFKWQSFDNENRLVSDKNFSFATISADGSSIDAKTWFNETAPDTAERLFPGPFSFGGREESLINDFVGARSSVESMVEYMVKAKPEQEGAINYVTEKILSENPNIDPMDFREQMAVALKDMTEGQNSGILDIKQEGAANLYQDTQGQDTITLAESIDANKTPVDEIMEQMQDVSNYEPRPIDDSIVGEGEIETDIDLALSRWKGQGYSSAFIETLRKEGKNDEFISELVSRINPDQAASEQETNYTTVYDEALGTGTGEEEKVITKDGVRSYNLTGGNPNPSAKKDSDISTGQGLGMFAGLTGEDLENIEAPQGQKNIIAKDAQQTIEELNKASKELTTQQATEANVVKAASIAGDTVVEQITRGDGQESVNDTLDRFAKEFMDRMPKFKGKTENEKGWDLIMLGSAIMGGTSPNALENIGKGFLATGDRFTSDDKAKRAYENDIQLGAAKYSLSKLATQEARDAADKRNITMMVAGKDMKYDGVDYEKGSLIQVNLTKLLEGPLPDGLTTQSLYSAALKTVDDANTVFAQNVAAATKLKNDTITKNTITRTEETALLAKNSKLTKSYKSSVTGRLYLNRAIDILNYNPDAISGGKSVVKEAYERFKNALNFNKDKYKGEWGKEDDDGNAWAARDSKTGEYLNATRQNYNMNVRIAFQNLIPVALAGVQSANSISNRDVQFLADAFIDSGALDENGLLNENVWRNVETIKARLNATNDLFLRQEEGFLEDMQKEFDSLGGRYRPMVDKSGDPGVARASSYVPENMPYLYNYQTGLPEEDDDGNLIPNPNYVGNYAATLREVNKKIRTTGYVKSADGKWRLK